MMVTMHASTLALCLLAAFAVGVILVVSLAADAAYPPG